jgi:phosphoglycolate phosphatase
VTIRSGAARAVVLDLDGTLVDTPQAIAVIMCEILTSMGRTPDDQIVRATVGKPLDSSFAQLLGVAVEHADVVAAIEDYKARFGAHIDATGEDLLYPGVAAGLRQMREAGLRVGLATSKVLVAANRTIRAAGIADLFDEVAGHDSVARGKPHPDMALVVAERLGCAPGDCVVVGDGVGDIEMGRAADMATLGVDYGVSTREQLVAAGADQVVGSFPDVVATITGPVGVHPAPPR